MSEILWALLGDGSHWPSAYKLELPPQSRIHLVFHVSLLKKAIQPSAVPQPLPSTLNEDLVFVVTPQELLDVRTMTQGDIEVLIQWQNLHLTENSLGVSSLHL